VGEWGSRRAGVSADRFSVPLPDLKRILLVTRDSHRERGPASPATNSPSALEFVESSDPEDSLSRFSNEPFSAVALEAPTPEDLHWVDRFRKIKPEAAVLLLVPEGDSEVRQRALETGAHAVIAEVRNGELLRQLVANALDTLRLATVNQRLADELWESARSLSLAVQKSKRARLNPHGRDSSLIPLPRGTSPRVVRVILVEDGRDDWIRRAAGFAEVNWAIEQFSKAEDARRRLEKMGRAPELILLGGDPGRAPLRRFLGWLRKDPILRHVTALAIHEPGQRIDLAAAYDSGVNSCIERPGTLADMIDLIRRTESYWSLHRKAQDK
jgi:hypothetical protein